MQVNVKMNYHVINYEPGAPGCPIFLSGLINKDWEWEPLDPTPDKFKISDDYFYRAKHRLIDFDFWSNEIMGSEEFTDLVKDMGGKIRKIPLKIIYPNQTESKKKYFYILWKEWHSMIDLEKSECTPSVDIYTGEKHYDKDFPGVLALREIKKFVLDKNKDPSKHIFKSLDFFNETICSEEFMQECIKRKFKGLSFTPIEDAQRIDLLAF